MPGVSYFNMYVSCCRRTFTFQMTGRQKYAAAMTGTIQGPIYLHIALEWLSLCDSGVWGWVAGILCCSSACWNKVDCWILFHNWIDFECSSLKVWVTTEEFNNIKTMCTFDFWQTLNRHLIQSLAATFYSFSTFWSGVVWLWMDEETAQNKENNAFERVSSKYDFQ